MISLCADGTRFVQDSVAKQHSVSCFAMEFQFLMPVIKSIYICHHMPIFLYMFLYFWSDYVYMRFVYKFEP